MMYLSAVGIVSVIYLFYVLARLSERLGSVEKMVPRYRHYYAAIAFLLVGLISLLATTQFAQTDQPFAAWVLLPVYHLPLTIGVTIGAITTWQYWSWLITENKQ
jgi:hypothetical protein